MKCIQCGKKTLGTWFGSMFMAICAGCRGASLQGIARTLRKKLSLASHVQETSRAIDAILEDIACYCFSDHTFRAVRIAVEEAVTNAIEHGNCGNPNKHVTVEYSVSEYIVEIVICDEGNGFRPDTLSDPRMEENLAKSRGRGVMLMRAYMSEVRFNELGNCVTLVKRRGCLRPAMSNLN